MDEFNFDSVRMNSYDLLLAHMNQQIRHHEIEHVSDVMRINGSLISSHFAPWLQDLKAAEGQTLTQLPSVADRFVGMQFLRKGHRKQSIIPAVSSGFAALGLMHAESFAKEIDRIEAVDLTEWFKDSRFSAEFIMLCEFTQSLPGEQRIPGFQHTNISQHYKNMQMRFRPHAFTWLDSVSHLIHRICYDLDARFRIRPMFTLVSSQSDRTRERLAQVDVSDPAEFYSLGQAAFLANMRANNANSYIHNYVDPIREQYWRWFYLPSYATIQFEDVNITMHLAPPRLPPFMFGRVTSDAVPYFCSPPTPTFLIEESVHYVSHWNPDSRNTPEVTLPVNMTEGIAVLAKLMPAYTALLTLLALTTQSGKGQHKPIWTASPYSLELMRILPRAIATAVKAGEEYLV